MENIVTEAILMSGGVMTAVLILLVSAKKFWGFLSEENLKTIRNGAEAALYANLKDDIQRTRDEISTLKASYAVDMENMKKNHEKERRELVARIKQLETMLNNIIRFNTTIKYDALILLDKIHNNDNDLTVLTDDIDMLLSKIVKEIDAPKTE